MKLYLCVCVCVCVCKCIFYSTLLIWSDVQIAVQWIYWIKQQQQKKERREAIKRALVFECDFYCVLKRQNAMSYISIQKKLCFYSFVVDIFYKSHINKVSHLWRSYLFLHFSLLHIVYTVAHNSCSLQGTLNLLWNLSFMIT